MRTHAKIERQTFLTRPANFQITVKREYELDRWPIRENSCATRKEAIAAAEAKGYVVVKRWCDILLGQGVK